MRWKIEEDEGVERIEEVERVEEAETPNGQTFMNLRSIMLT